MATQTAVLSVKVLVDSTKAAMGLDKASGSVSKFQSGLKKAAAPAGLALGAVVAFAKGAGEAASRAQQAMGGIDAVFGKNADTVKGWAADSAQAVGLASSEYGELATIIGSQLKNAGLPMDEVMGKTKDLIGLGADLAATYGGTTADAVAALSSALKGETDPIERYGASIKQSAVQAELARRGQSKLKGEALKSATANATLALVMEQTADATGKFASESDTAAGQQQRANAEWENTKATLGTALLPIMTAVSEQLGKMAKWAAENATTVQILVGVIAAVAAVILTLNVALTAWTAIQWALNTAVLGFPIFWIVAAIIALIAVIILVIKKWDVIKKAGVAAWNAIKAAAAAVWSWLKSAALSVAGAVVGVWNRIKQAGISAWNAVKSSAQTVWTTVKGVFDKIAGAVKAVRDKLTGDLARAFDALLHPIDSVSSAFQTLWGWVQKVIDGIGRIKIPHIPGLGKIVGGSSVAAPSPSLRGLGATRATSSGGSGLTIVVQPGGLDTADSIARRIDSVVTGRRRRTGQVRIGRVVPT